MYDVIVPATELQNLFGYKLCIRTLLDGRPQEPHPVEAFPPFDKTGKETTAEMVVRVSRERYGRSRLTIEKRLNEFLTI
jgi:hypothetical protein